MKGRSGANCPQILLGFKILIHPLVWISHFKSKDFSGCLVCGCRNMSIYHAYYVFLLGFLSRVYFRFCPSSAPPPLLKILIKKRNANMVYEYLKCDLHLTNYTWSHNSQCGFASGKNWEYVFYIKSIAFKYFNTNKLLLNINLSPKDLARHIKYLKLFLITKFLNPLNISTFLCYL